MQHAQITTATGEGLCLQHVVQPLVQGLQDEIEKREREYLCQLSELQSVVHLLQRDLDNAQQQVQACKVQLQTVCPGSGVALQQLSHGIMPQQGVQQQQLAPAVISQPQPSQGGPDRANKYSDLETYRTKYKAYKRLYHDLLLQSSKDVTCLSCGATAPQQCQQVQQSTDNALIQPHQLQPQQQLQPELHRGLQLAPCSAQGPTAQACHMQELPQQACIQDRVVAAAQGQGHAMQPAGVHSAPAQPGPQLQTHGIPQPVVVHEPSENQPPRQGRQQQMLAASLLGHLPAGPAGNSYTQMFLPSQSPASALTISFQHDVVVQHCDDSKLCQVQVAVRNSMEAMAEQGSAGAASASEAPGLVQALRMAQMLPATLTEEVPMFYAGQHQQMQLQHHVHQQEQVQQPHQVHQQEQVQLQHHVHQQEQVQQQHQGEQAQLHHQQQQEQLQQQEDCHPWRLRHQAAQALQQLPQQTSSSGGTGQGLVAAGSKAALSQQPTAGPITGNLLSGKPVGAPHNILYEVIPGTLLEELPDEGVGLDEGDLAADKTSKVVAAAAAVQLATPPDAAPALITTVVPAVTADATGLAARTAAVAEAAHAGGLAAGTAGGIAGVTTRPAASTVVVSDTGLAAAIALDTVGLTAQASAAAAAGGSAGLAAGAAALMNLGLGMEVLPGTLLEDVDLALLDFCFTKQNHTTCLPASHSSPGGPASVMPHNATAPPGQQQGVAYNTGPTTAAAVGQIAGQSTGNHTSPLKCKQLPQGAVSAAEGVPASSFQPTQPGPGTTIPDAACDRAPPVTSMHGNGCLSTSCDFGQVTGAGPVATAACNSRQVAGNALGRKASIDDTSRPDTSEMLQAASGLQSPGGMQRAEGMQARPSSEAVHSDVKAAAAAAAASLVSSPRSPSMMQRLSSAFAGKAQALCRAFWRDAGSPAQAAVSSPANRSTRQSMDQVTGTSIDTAGAKHESSLQAAREQHHMQEQLQQAAQPPVAAVQEQHTDSRLDAELCVSKHRACATAVVAGQVQAQPAAVHRQDVQPMAGAVGSVRISAEEQVQPHVAAVSIKQEQDVVIPEQDGSSMQLTRKARSDKRAADNDAADNGAADRLVSASYHTKPPVKKQRRIDALIKCQVKLEPAANVPHQGHAQLGSKDVEALQQGQQQQPQPEKQEQAKRAGWMSKTSHKQDKQVRTSKQTTVNGSRHTARLGGSDIVTQAVTERQAGGGGSVNVGVKAAGGRKSVLLQQTSMFEFKGFARQASYSSGLCNQEPKALQAPNAPSDVVVMEVDSDDGDTATATTVAGTTAAGEGGMAAGAASWLRLRTMLAPEQSSQQQDVQPDMPQAGAEGNSRSHDKAQQQQQQLPKVPSANGTKDHSDVGTGKRTVNEAQGEGVGAAKGGEVDSLGAANAPTCGAGAARPKAGSTVAAVLAAAQQIAGRQCPGKVLAQLCSSPHKRAKLQSHETSKPIRPSQSSPNVVAAGGKKFRGRVAKAAAIQELDFGVEDGHLNAAGAAAGTSTRPPIPTAACPARNEPKQSPPSCELGAKSKVSRPAHALCDLLFDDESVGVGNGAQGTAKGAHGIACNPSVVVMNLVQQQQQQQDLTANGKQQGVARGRKPDNGTAGKQPSAPGVRPSDKSKQEPTAQASDKDSKARTILGGNVRQGDAGATAGPGYKFSEVVRGQADRAALPAYACTECQGIYEYLARNPSLAHLSSDVLRCTAHGTTLMNTWGRHRAAHQPPSTPPGYWHLGFPDETE